MSTPWTPAQRLAAYKAEGITKIVPMPGWAEHNRDDETGREFGPVHGALIHHTAGVGQGMASFCYSGSRELPGPLCHDFLAKDGTLYLIGHGRTNHAGTTTRAVKNAIIAEQPPERQRTIGSETEDANDFLFGLEIENKGDGSDPYPPEQMAVALKWATAHARFYGWSANSVWGHKEITTRKVDPSFNMATFRQAVAGLLAVTPKPPATSTPGVRAMQFTSLAMTDAPLTIPAGESRTIYWDAEYQDGSGDHGTGGKTIVSGEHFTGVVALKFGMSLPPNVKVRMVHELDAGGTSDDYTADVTAAEFVFPYTGRVAEDRNLVLEVENAWLSPVVLNWAAVRGGTWAL